ncbi:hypothetical protein HQQ80_14375 [Microbacteriaceae bacterium VKM Ac-2855]|nr:hypothetical protein [Microbacteriaceae bacterium VKM Ac-2855]
MSRETDTAPRSAEDRVATARATLSTLAGSYSERAVRPIADAVTLAIASFADGDTARAHALLDSVDAYADALAAAEAQLSTLERSIRADLASAAVLLSVRTDAHLASAFEVSTATAAASAALLDVENARTGALHDPVELLALLSDVDADIDAAIADYRTAPQRARRRLAAIEASRLGARIRCDAVAILIEAHPEVVSDAARHLCEQALAELEESNARLAGDPLDAEHAARSAALHAGAALDAALIDLAEAGTALG